MLRFFALVNILFSCGANRDVVVEPPEIVFDIVLDGVSGVVLVLVPSLLCDCVTFYNQDFPSIQGAKLIVLIYLYMAPVPLERVLFELGVNC